MATLEMTLKLTPDEGEVAEHTVKIGGRLMSERRISKSIVLSAAELLHEWILDKTEPTNTEEVT